MNIINKIKREYSLKIIRTFWCHRFNPLYTLYFNFIFFPLRQAIKFPVFVYGWPRLYSQYGRMECKDKCKTGMVKLNLTIPGGPQYATGNSELNIWGKIIFRGTCEIGSGNKINVGEMGVLDLGDGTKITSFCNITSYSEIKVGEQSRIAHRCQVLDTNFHFIADFNKSIVKKLSHPITIGSYCWICNSSTITGGATIPDKTIVASNSLVGKDFSTIPSESIIGGIPAKLISTGFRSVENERFISKINKFFTENPDELSFKFDHNINHSICDVNMYK